VGLVAVAEEQDDGAVGAFGQVAFVVAQQTVALRHRKGADRLPAPAVVRRFLDTDVVELAVGFVRTLPDVEDAAVAELHGPWGVVTSVRMGSPHVRPLSADRTIQCPCHGPRRDW